MRTAFASPVVIENFTLVLLLHLGFTLLFTPFYALTPFIFMFSFIMFWYLTPPFNLWIYPSLKPFPPILSFNEASLYSKLTSFLSYFGVFYSAYIIIFASGGLGWLKNAFVTSNFIASERDKLIVLVGITTILGVKGMIEWIVGERNDLIRDGIKLRNALS